MIEKGYVTFETAKLLKEAGFPQDRFLTYYNENGALLTRGTISAQRFARCTKWHAMQWLRDEHKISIEPSVTLDETWALCVWKFDKVGIIISPDDLMRFDTYEEAAEAGIQAACKYLISNNADPNKKDITP